MLYIAILLGIIEGITEFLPVSSTGHLILFGDMLGFKVPGSEAFEIIIQLGAILAICWLYRRKLIVTTRGIIARKRRALKFTLSVTIAFLPAILFGVLLHGFIKTVLFNPVNVSIALIVGGVVILVVERIKPEARYRKLETLSFPLCLKIGLCQCLALIPGTSRSGATIIGALLLGVERKTAAEFSFFLAIPTMFAATVYDLFKSWNTLTLDSAGLIAVGFVTAFISALFVVKLFIAYISKHGFTPFAWYRIVIGAVMLYLLQG